MAFWRRSLSDNETRDVLNMHLGQLERRLEDRFDSIDRVMKSAFESLSTRMQTVETKADKLGRPDMLVLVTAGLVVCTMMGGLWMVGSLKVEATTTPVMLEVSTIKTAQQDIQRRIDAVETSRAIATREYRDTVSQINTEITRLNVWNDFMHAKVFPDQPQPPLKQP